LPSDSLVKDAVSQVTEKVLRNVVERDERPGDAISVSVLPSIADTSSVSEWARRNMDQPPLIIVRSSDRLAESPCRATSPEVDMVDVQRMVEEQTQLLVALQGQLNEQLAVIRNQATFIEELQSNEREKAVSVRDHVTRIEEDVAAIRGQLLGLEERCQQSGPCRGG